MHGFFDFSRGGFFICWYCCRAQSNLCYFCKRCFWFFIISDCRLHRMPQQENICNIANESNLDDAFVRVIKINPLGFYAKTERETTKILMIYLKKKNERWMRNNVFFWTTESINSVLHCSFYDLRKEKKKIRCYESFEKTMMIIPKWELFFLNLFIGPTQRLVKHYTHTHTQCKKINKTNNITNALWIYTPSANQDQHPLSDGRKIWIIFVFYIFWYSSLFSRSKKRSTGKN